MSTVEMTVQKALEKKKIYENQIAKKIGEYGRGNLPGLMVYSITEVQESINGIPKDEKIEQMKAEYQSIRHLISNLSNIKVAINNSNATTEITVAGKTYTKADAIAKQRALDSEKGFLDLCIKQYYTVLRKINDNNEQVMNADNISNYLNRILSPESKKNSELISKLTEDYKKEHLLILLDPNNFAEELVKWQNEITEFESEIHTALVTSNVSTMITVELED